MAKPTKRKAPLSKKIGGPFIEDPRDAERRSAAARKGAATRRARDDKRKAGKIKPEFRPEMALPSRQDAVRPTVTKIKGAAKSYVIPTPPPLVMAPNFDQLTAAYQTIVDALVVRCSSTEAERENMAGTAARAARALLEMNRSVTDIQAEILNIVGVVFPNNGDRQLPMVVEGPITATGICPHHLLPVLSKVTVAYLPKAGAVLGLSKLARIVRLLAARPILQEQFAEDVADVLYLDNTHPNASGFACFESAGSAVHVNSFHCCMACRGVHSDARTTVTSVRGGFQRDSSLELRFIEQLRFLAAEARNG